MSNEFFFQAGGPNPSLIPNSLRFRGAQRLTQAPRGGDSSRQWSMSFWMKLGGMSSNGDPQNYAFGASSYGNLCQGIVFDFPNNSNYGSFAVPFNIGINGEGFNTNGADKLRDPSAWYHVFVRWDGTANSNAIRAWVNNHEVTWTQTKSGWYDMINRLSVERMIGCTYGGTYASYLDGYLAEFHFVDNQVLSPTTFAEYDDNGVWIPKSAGTKVSDYGTNGFYLDFSNPSNVGQDKSGKGNNFTATGFELTNTSSTSYDWMEDSPTNNYSTINPLIQNSHTITEANLRMSAPNGGGWGFATPRIPRSGKYYYEYTHSGGSGTYGTGIFAGSAAPGFNTSVGMQYRPDGTTYLNGSLVRNVGWPGSIVGVELDMDNWTIEAFIGGSSFGGKYNLTQNVDYLIYTGAGGGGQTQTGFYNFGQRAFSRTPSAGFSPLSTAELPDVAVTNPDEHFRTFTDTGSNIVNNAFSQFPNGLWYFKSYSNSQDHWWRDSLNGASKSWHTPGTDVRAMETISGNAVAAGWATNASGLNAEAGFQMITYSGNSSARTIAHSLGAVPAMIWVKCTNANANTVVYHQNLNADQFLSLNNGNQPQSDNNKWNNTRPTASVFSLGSNDEVNASGRTYVAYIWVEVPGYSAFGRYRGNNNQNGVFLYNGFRPRVVCTKQIDGNNGWFWRNASLDTYNPVKNITSWTEGSYQQRDYIDFLSNGWKARCGGGVTDGSGTNTGEYVYFAFAEHPFGGSNVYPSPAR